MPRSRTVRDDTIGAGSKLVVHRLTKYLRTLIGRGVAGTKEQKRAPSPASRNLPFRDALANPPEPSVASWLVKQEISLWRLGVLVGGLLRIDLGWLAHHRSNRRMKPS